MDMNIEMIKHFILQNPNMVDAFNSVSSSENLLPEFPTSYPYNNILSALSSIPVKTLFDSSEDQNYVFQENKKRKVMGKSEILSPTSSSTVISDSKKSLGTKKRSRRKEHGEIIHVRANRGQATDNHSLAERLRREKINQKMRCLQDLVPGCNRTMGMVVMLEEIINYVHSLQNQVEFLSMELGAASSSNVQSIEAESSMKSQGTNRHEEQEIENLVRNQHGELGCFHSTWTF